MYTSLFQLAGVMAIALIGGSAALPTVDNSVEANAHTLHKRYDLPPLDWDKKAKDQKKQKKAISKAWKGMLEMSYEISRPDQHEKEWPRVVDHYFVKEQHKPALRVFQMIANLAKKPKDVKSGGEQLSAVQLTNKPIRGAETYCNNPEMTSHSAWIDRKWVIRICPSAFSMPVFETKCKKLDEETSGRMNSIAGLILYEVLKIPALGSAAVGFPITDEDRGPQVAQMARIKTGNYNLQSANHFQWFALELFYTIKCKKDFGVPMDNADYLEPKHKRSTGEGWKAITAR